MKSGEYVLGTKWWEGDPKDPWYIGFYFGKRNNLHYLMDERGDMISPGFRRVEKISKEKADWIFDNIKDIDLSGKNLWYFKRKKS